MAASGKAAEHSLARIWSDTVFKIAAAAASRTTCSKVARPCRLLDRDPQLEAVLAKPLVSVEEKRQLIEKGFRGKGRATCSSIRCRSSAARAGWACCGIAVTFRDTWMESKNQVESRSPAPCLSPGLRQSLVAAASRFAGKEAQLTERSIRSSSAA